MDVFYTKYFHEEETVTLATLQATKQRNGEDLMEYIKRFRDIALNCYDNCEERMLVEMCMTNMIREYRAVMENLEISSLHSYCKKPERLPVHEAKFRQKKRPASNGSIY